MPRFKNFIMIFFSLIFALALSNSRCDYGDDEREEPYIPGTEWTIMIYGDGDNDLESFLIKDVNEMKAGYINGQGINLIVLADRNPGYSTDYKCFGSNFTDTRLYRITHGKATRIGGELEFPEITTFTKYEANMADAVTLQKFVRFCKANYPANNYCLVLWDHGGGPRKKGTEIPYDGPYKGIIEDFTTGSSDIIFTAEITDYLTADDYVDLLCLDACLMGSVEIACQYRPGNGSFYANYMVASAPEVWLDGFKYSNILARLKSGGGTNGEINNVAGSGPEMYYDPASMTTEELCGVMVEEQYDSTNGLSTTESLSCYDLSKVADVKAAADLLAKQLAADNRQSAFETIRGCYDNPNINPFTYSDGTLHYFDGTNIDAWRMRPLFDLYDLSKNVKEDTTNFPSCTSLANNVMTAVDDMILYSFAGSTFPVAKFTNGKTGLSIFFPDGDTLTYNSNRHWYAQRWYNPLDTSSSGLLYGKLAWCSGGTLTDVAENWFEMLDKWFDTGNGLDGGLNRYQY